MRTVLDVLAVVYVLGTILCVIWVVHHPFVGLDDAGPYEPDEEDPS